MYAFVLAVTLAQLISGLGRHHDDPAVLESIAEEHPLPAAFGPVRITGGRIRLRETFRDLEPAALAHHAERQINDLLDVGREGEARALYELLPEAARRQLTESARRLDEVAALAKLRRDDRDLFDLVVETLKEPPAGTKARLLAARFERNGYPSIAADLLRREVWRWEDLDDDSSPDVAPLLAMVRADVQSMRSRAALLAPEPLGSPTVRLLLRTPRLQPFHTYPMPAEIDPGMTVVLDPGDSLYGNFAYPLRREQLGDQSIALGLSQSIDPTGHESVGAYWIFIDGRAYYTGLREKEPFVAVESSRLPLFDGEHVRIEVEGHIYVDFALDDLARDSDHDGLTDLIEERLVMDPHQKDTDGDGIEDLDDMLPQVAKKDLETDKLLAEALWGIRPDHEPSDRHGEAIDEDIRFIVGDGALFAALNAPLRTIVLSPAERVLYEKKFGVFEPKVIRTWAVDRSGTRAVVQFETLFSLETLVLRKTAYGWFIADHTWSRG